jgi:hypothetical protein
MGATGFGGAWSNGGGLCPSRLNFALRLSEKSKRASKRDPTCGSEEQKTRHRSLFGATDTRPETPSDHFSDSLLTEFSEVRHLRSGTIC